jgi:uncharacterized protein (TIGR02600 family)
MLSRDYHRGRRSSALIIVLACLVFISVLIVAFFAAVTTERQSAQFYANSSSVKLLADSTLSIVMGQIVNATRGTDASGNTLSWASQPGMIRNYDTSANAAGYYKLYSWTNMIGTGAFNPFATGEQPSSSWASQPAIYTDLNDPIVEGSGSSAITNYPVVDPSATNTVVGFSITNAPTSTTDYAPMPVQWLYVLQQGQVIAPDSGGSTTAKFTTAATKPSASNPIVGRIAFWTDDDTSKININTAAGDVWVNASSASGSGQPAYGANTGNPGSFWDTPRVWDNYETNLSMYQPANGEYQRYPGHPSTVALSAVFPTILTTSTSILALTPRVSYGGSKSGTTYPGASMLTLTGTGGVAYSRLYDSVDELICSTNTTGSTPPSRSINSPLTKSNIEQGKFFLTAASRAPEVNLFNEPRVIIWPVNEKATVNGSISMSATGVYATPFDDLIAFCGTLNGNLYFFQRDASSPGKSNGGATGAYSTSDDLPNTAGSTSATDLTRNRQLITYLRNLTSQQVPGFSTDANSTFLKKYPNDRDEILTEIFDYIRSVNGQDQMVTSPYTPTPWLTRGEGQIFPIIDNTHADSNANTLRGFGRMPVITEASLLFVGIGQTSSTGTTSMASTTSGTIANGYTRIQAALLLKFFDPSQGYAPLSPNYQITVAGLSKMNWSASSSGSSTMGFKDPTSIVVTTYVSSPSAATGGEIGITPCVWASSYTGSFVSTKTLDAQGGTMALPGTFSISDTQFTVTLCDTYGAVLQTYNMEFPGASFPVPGMAPAVTDGSGNQADFRNLVSTTSGTNAGNGRFGNNSSNTLQSFICGTDTVRSIALTTDPRTIAAMATVPLQYNAGAFAGKNVYQPLNNYYSSIFQVHGILDMDNGNHRPLAGFVGGSPLVPNVTYSYTGAKGDLTYPSGTATLAQAWGTGVQISTSPVNGGASSSVQTLESNTFTSSGGYAVTQNGVYLPISSTTVSGTYNGDWDTGNGSDKDGAYINKADEGAIPYNITGQQIPYYGAGYRTSTPVGSSDIIALGANFSPNRQIPSAGMFGSLPTGVFSNRPWQTLLFRPSPDGNVLPSENPVHIGAQNPQDHLLMDLFTMPIVEPYAISDPFSTAGKINMNYQIVPFTYITRSTAIQAALRSEQIMAIPANAGASVNPYKGSGSFNYRYLLDLSQTLTGFTNMFTTGTPDGSGNTADIFRSATQICDIWLVPAGLGLSYSGMTKFWNDTTTKGGALTGDNVRERPYANIYQKLTTKSNTYTVHMRVQTLKMTKNADPSYTTWVEGSDVITGEYRGSSTIERYLDTSSKNIPDYALMTQPPAAGQAIDNFYKFRVVETKQFTP